MCATEKKRKVLPLMALFLLPKLVGHHYENSFAKVKKRKKTSCENQYEIKRSVKILCGNLIDECFIKLHNHNRPRIYSR